MLPQRERERERERENYIERESWRLHFNEACYRHCLWSNQYKEREKERVGNYTIIETTLSPTY
jgi:hypothetical protein